MTTLEEKRILNCRLAALRTRDLKMRCYWEANAIELEKKENKKILLSLVKAVK